MNKGNKSQDKEVRIETEALRRTERDEGVERGSEHEDEFTFPSRDAYEISKATAQVF
jgi:hypothetical protein